MTWDPPTMLSIGQDGTGILEVDVPRIAEGDAAIPLRVRAGGMSFAGEARIDPYSGGYRAFTDYFRDLAEHWRGWSGSKEWADDGGTVRLSATHDGIGRVTLAVELRSEPFGGLGSWRATTEVGIEPGALAWIPSELAELADAT